jgi:nucleoside-diphosphate-sugar epimerase
MKFLVTGGSGFLGHNICRYLVNKGHKVASLDIEEFDYHVKVKAYRGDIRDKNLAEDAMKGIDVVVHAAAALPLWPEKEIFSTNVEGTRILLEAALKRKVKKFIFISSTAVYGIPKKHPIYESDPLFGVGPYGESKILAEQICREYREKMCVPILRPKTFVGRGRLGVFQILFEWIRSGKNIPIIGNGKNRYQLMDVDDLCSAIYIMAKKPREKVNDTFNVGAEKFKTMKEDYQDLLDYAGFGKKVIKLPALPAITALKILWVLRISPLYSWTYETANKDSFVSVDKIKKLGWSAEKSNSQALIESYRWYLQHYKEYEGKSGIKHTDPWKQGILSFVGRFF